ncbi:hypothetical protein Hte_009723 [Hypoxylon texense]
MRRMPKTVRVPRASPIRARHHAMKKKPRTASMLPTTMPPMELLYALNKTPKMESAVRTPNVVIMQTRRAKAVGSDVSRLYASQLKWKQPRKPGQFRSLHDVGWG